MPVDRDGGLGEDEAAPAVDLLMRLFVCWWKHRTRKVGPGTYLTTECRACSGRRR